MHRTLPAHTCAAEMDFMNYESLPFSTKSKTHHWVFFVIALCSSLCIGDEDRTRKDYVYLHTFACSLLGTEDILYHLKQAFDKLQPCSKC